MRYEETELAITEEDLKEFERVTQVKLPESFKRHYLTHNGGYPVDMEEIAGRDYVFPFHGFFPLKHGALTIESVKNDLAEDFGIPDAVPFGYDQGSNIFYISTNASDSYAVFQITAETQQKFFVCATFDDFLNGLQPAA